MKAHPILSVFAILATLFCVSISTAQDLKTIELPPPQKTIGKPLMEVLQARKSTREYSAKKLPLQEVSNLLWAAWGVNRSEDGNRRTAPSAVNFQEIEVYAAMEDGLYLYDAIAHELKPVVAGDNRAATGGQAFVGVAPLNFVYVADYSKMSLDDNSKEIVASADTGFIGQNVYLYCASQGLATVVRGMIDKEKLRKIMKLRPDQHIILAQTIGYQR